MEMYEQRSLDEANQSAIQRTMLANEQTLVAYEQTAIMFLAVGVLGGLLLSNDRPLAILSWVIAAGGFFLAVFGVCRFVYMRHRIVMSAKKL